MCKSIRKQMVVAPHTVQWISIMKRPRSLIAIKIHTCDTKIGSCIPMAHVTHGILNMLRCGWLKISKSDLVCFYIKMQSILHGSIYLMAGIVKQGQVNFKTTTWTAPFTDNTTNKTNAAAILMGATDAIEVNKGFKFHSPSLHIMKRCFNYRNTAFFHMPHLEAV